MLDRAKKDSCSSPFGREHSHFQVIIQEDTNDFAKKAKCYLASSSSSSGSSMGAYQPHLKLLKRPVFDLGVKKFGAQSS
jgi:hypothetical protein